MTCEVHNKEINSQCAELLVRPTYIICVRINLKKCEIVQRYWTQIAANG